MMALRSVSLSGLVMLAAAAAVSLAFGCETKRPNGAACLKDRDCESERCRSGVCVPVATDNTATAGTTTASMGGAGGMAGSGSGGHGGSTGGSGGQGGVGGQAGAGGATGGGGSG